MNAEEFVNGLQRVTYQAVIEDVPSILANPPGRQPRPELVKLSSWYKTLSGEDQQRVEDVVRLAADHAIFGVLAVLDGVRAFDDKHTELYLRTGDGVLLNEHPELHDLFRAIVDEETGFKA